MASQRKPYLLFAKILLPIGLVFAIIGCGIALEVYLFLQRAEPTTAVVVDYERKLSNPNSASSASFYPIVSIRAESGESIRAETNVGRSPPAYEIGAQLNVLYDPESPGKARVNTRFGLWGAAALFAGFGTLFLMMGGIVKYRGRRAV